MPPFCESRYHVICQSEALPNVWMPDKTEGINGRLAEALSSLQLPNRKAN